MPGLHLILVGDHFVLMNILAGTPTDLIMTISGHKTEKAFRRYIKADKV